jgi:hypothetical protein
MIDMCIIKAIKYVEGGNLMSIAKNNEKDLTKEYLLNRAYDEAVLLQVIDFTVQQNCIDLDQHMKDILSSDYGRAGTSSAQHKLFATQLNSYSWGKPTIPQQCCNFLYYLACMIPVIGWALFVLSEKPYQSKLEVIERLQNQFDCRDLDGLAGSTLFAL